MAQPIQIQLNNMQQAINDLQAGLYGMAVGPGSISNQMIQPKSVNAGMIDAQNLQSITAKTGALTVSGALTVGTAGSFGSGQTAYNTGTGFWLEYNSGTPRLSIGNSAGNKLTWDGTNLAITGSITATTGTIGGWTIGSTTLTGGNVTLDSSAGIKLASGNSSAAALVNWTVSGSGYAYAMAETDGAAMWLGRTSGYTVKLTTTAAQLSSDSPGSSLIAPKLIVNGTGIQVAGAIYPGTTAYATQSTRYIADNGTRIVVAGGELDVSSNTINFGGPLVASGAFPAPTKAIVVKVSGTSYYIPVLSGYNAWTA